MRRRLALSVRPGLGLLLGGLAVAACGGGNSGPSATLSIVTQPPATVQTRAAFPTSPVVQLLNGQGAPKSGVTVTATLVGSGTLNGTASVPTDGNGNATFSGLSITGLAGTKQIKFKAQGVPAVTSNNVLLTAGPAAQLAVYSGNNQTALVSNAVAASPSVRVSDLDGNGIGNVAITFAVTAGGGSITGATPNTDGNGVATVGSWTLGPNPGPNTLTVSAAGLTDVTIDATGTLVTSQFNITLLFLTAPTASQNAAFQSARARWESAIINDLSDVNFNQNSGNGCGNKNVNQTIDDVLILVDLKPIDGVGGTLGTSGPCFIRNSNGLPTLGYMKFDTADLANIEAAGKLDRVIIHEMGHVLGYGTLWDQAGFTLLDGGGTADPTFNGTAALNAFLTLNDGGLYTGTPIPVEGTPAPVGTRDAHWRESVFNTELMTGFIGNETVDPLSATSIKSLEDLGYTVNLAAADPFDLATALLAGPPTVEVDLSHDILPIRPIRLDARGKPMP
jgi:leishmanolysin